MEGGRYRKQAESSVNPRFARGGPGEVRIQNEALGRPGAKFDRVLPPLSVTVLELSK